MAPFSGVYFEPGSSPEDANFLFSPPITTHLKTDSSSYFCFGVAGSCKGDTWSLLCEAGSD